MIVNFTANSLKFGARTVRLSARAEEGRVRFAVADDGPGISAAEQRNLFIRFSRLKSVRNSAIPGTGLGLAVSRSLAERMGGSVGVASVPGRGSTFFLLLPLEAADGAASPSSEFRAHGDRALVVEDIEYNARAVKVMLGKLGFNVDIAGDGGEARLAAGCGPVRRGFPRLRPSRRKRGRGCARLPGRGAPRQADADRRDHGALDRRGPGRRASPPAWMRS